MVAPSWGEEPVRWSLERDGLSDDGKWPGTMHALDTVTDADGVTSLRWAGPQSRIDLPGEVFREIGEGDFSLGLWLSLEDVEPAGGDILSLNDKEGRGLSLSVVTRSGSTSSVSADRQLTVSLFDVSSDPGWIDRGRPGHAVFVHSLVVHRGRLLAGVCQTGPGERGEVFEYQSPHHWRSLGSPDESNAITAMAVYRGELYAGTGKYRLAGSALPESTNAARGGRIYRLGPDGDWKLVGDLVGAEAVGGMVVYRDRLWVSSLYKPAALYSLDMKDQWRAEPLPEEDRRLESMAVFGDALYATSYDNAHVYRLQDQRWEDVGNVGENTQTYAFASYRSQLYVSTWPSGRVYRLGAPNSWEDTGRLGEELEVMGLAVHRGSLWGGTLPSADVYRYRSGERWIRQGTVDETRGVKYRRAWTMAVHAGELFVGTLPSGHVRSTRTGESITWDESFPKGWHHLMICRARGEMSVWVDGECVGRARRAGDKPVSLDRIERVTIGQGDHYPFAGRLRNLSLYRSALSGAEVKQAAAVRP